MIERDLWLAYCSTLLTYRDQSNALKTVTPVLFDSDPWPWGNAIQEISVLSAANPYSEKLSDEANLEYERQLKEELTKAGFKYRSCHGASSDGKWVERSILIINAPQVAIVELGDKFLQNAYFRWTPESWEVISLVSVQHLVSGWQFS